MLNRRDFAKEAANQIWVGNKEVDLTSYLENALQQKGFSIRDPEILENFDKLKNLIFRLIQRKIEECNRKGIKPRYEFSTVDSDILVPQTDTSSDKVRAELVSTIRQLSWRAFEHFCVHILTISGVKNCKTMRGTKEEGIDFFGVLDLGYLTGTSLWYGAHIRVLGQAKTNSISEQAVRLFNQDLRSFLNGEGRAFKLAPEWFKAATTPVIGIMLTSEVSTGGATKWANRHNIVIKDLQQIVEDLCRDSRPTPGLCQTGKKTSFNKKTFLHNFEHRT